MSAQDRLTDALYGLGWSTVKKLPEPVAVRLGHTIADLAWKQRGKGVQRLESNYARVVPGASPERLAELSRAGMRSYLRYWMESFRLPAWSKERIAGGFVAKDLHYLTEGLAAGKGVILALPHLANWDLAGAWVTTKLGIPFTTVAERLKPETLYDRFVAYREGLGMEVLPHSGGTAFGTLARRLPTAAWSAWSPTATCPPPASRSTSSVTPPECRPDRPCSPSRRAPCCSPSPSGTTTRP